MSISGIEGIGAAGFTPYVAPQVGATQTTGLSTGTSDVTGSGKEFGSMVLDGIDRLERVQDTSDQLAVKAATGDLNAIHDYTIAATEANVTTQLTVAVRNKAVEAFNEIMRMQV
jgi:flagellar hook-basal body complex protein FliE